MIPVAIAIVAIGAICYGLAEATPDLPPPQSHMVTSTGKSTAKTVAPNDRIVMHVNGEPITEREFSAFVAEAPEQMQFYYMSPEGRRMLADEVVKLKALEQEGRRLGVDKDPAVVTRLEMTETNIVAGSALSKIIGPPDDAKLRAAYEKEKAGLESAELSHILIAYQGGNVPPRTGQPPTEAQAVQKAQRLAQRIKGGADFAAVAQQESDDLQSAQQGGSLGVIQPGSLPPQIQNAVSRLATGEVSAPVKSEFGIHLFKAGERRSQPFEAVRDALAARMQREEAAKVMERLHKSAKVELDEKYFAPAKTPAPTRGQS
ncbi:MAG: peptidylprolyl isomerase [Thermoanaerobaculia bacterium]